ncbi:hypothetical protein K1719_011887 [Acacia pycnantha]|nr:hypothetical protein K1719_011887 [Acacia pycnantha]
MVTTPPMDEKAAPRFPYLAQLRELFRDIPLISLEMRAGIVGAEKTYPITIDNNDLGEFMPLECLDIEFLQVAIIVCHDICVQNARTAPIIEGRHWTLVVVCPAKNACYWLDSLGGKPNDDIKTMFAEGLKTYRHLSGAKEQGGPKWYYPKCPRQPGDIECRYYVIHFMQSIISTGRLTGFQHISSAIPIGKKHGHEVNDCYHRYDRNYRRPNKSKDATAYVAKLETIADSVQYLDTGAVHHDFENVDRAVAHSRFKFSFSWRW